MTKVTNSEIKRCADQIFAYGRNYETPFYNRIESQKELKDKYKKFPDSHAFFISAPIGTGKTFFIDFVGADIGLAPKEKQLYVKTATTSSLNKVKDNIIFVDEGDIKTSWEGLTKGLESIASHISKTGQNAIILGDYCLKNPQLINCFNSYDYMQSFEPLNAEFLKGVLRQRIKEYVKKEVDNIVEDALMDILTPKWTVNGASFRTILTFFSKLVRTLPANNAECIIRLDVAKKWVEDIFDPALDTEKQVIYLNLLLDYIAEKHPNGCGLDNGLSTIELFSIAYEAGYKDIEEFKKEIIEPFTRNELLVSTGMPYLDERGVFVRRPEPYVPSIMIMLLM